MSDLETRVLAAEAQILVMAAQIRGINATGKPQLMPHKAYSSEAEHALIPLKYDQTRHPEAHDIIGFNREQRRFLAACDEQGFVVDSEGGYESCLAYHTEAYMTHEGVNPEWSKHQAFHDWDNAWTAADKVAHTDEK